ncbi:FkbM family methyltransferase [Sulfolobus sp. E5-1-F]|uniref:FkbM family methyltransferase n=1 Tax=Saccharolobus sp. E5-1-F TaxID=2663019 RepID=UPI0012958EE9|nr:FkbM family methyltransferase [Sulfolobus sp. E5-1-F]QGA53815.1 FkbM family methyltransferase [Sulfolobus sp. E5-1-F]
MIFSYGKSRIEIPDEYGYVYYATFIAGEWDFLRVNNNDVVLDAGAFIGDFTIKVARKAKEVVAVEPLPWAFKLLKRNVELNELKNVVLVNKALYFTDGLKVKIRDNGVGSRVDEKEGEIEVDTVTIDSLGKFSVVKMDIEGAESEVFKREEWLNYVRLLGIELHGEGNIVRIPRYLTSKGFSIKEMTKTDLIKNAIRNIVTHPLDFLKAETRTKTIMRTMSREYKVPALSNENLVRIVYGKRIVNARSTVI